MLWTASVQGSGLSLRACRAQHGARRVWVPEASGCPVFDRYRLGPAEATLAGPAIVEERETTVVLGPGDHARVDAHANLVVDLPPLP